MTAFTILILTFANVQSLVAQRKNKTPQSKTSAPQTVTDFYMLLPEKYFPFFDRVKNRRDLIEGEQIKNGYLNFVGNRPGMPLDNEMLLLKRTNNIPMLVIAYTDCFNDCEAVLRFVEYENGLWRETEAAPKFDAGEMRETYRRQTGRNADEKLHVIYSLSPVDKSLTVKIGGEADVEIYKLEWNGNVYRFAAQER